MNEQGIRLFTDGNVKVINKEKGIFTGSRDVEIINSTFTLMVEYTNKNVDAIEIRGLSIGNYEVIAEDAIALLYNQNAGFISNIGYKELDKEKPKVYILKKH